MMRQVFTVMALWPVKQSTSTISTSLLVIDSA